MPLAHLMRWPPDVQIDVFDGNFVPTLTLGPPVVKSLRKHTEAFLDCHLVSLPA